LFVVLLSAIYVVASAHSAQSAKISIPKANQLRVESNSDTKFTPNLFYQISLSESAGSVAQFFPPHGDHFQSTAHFNPSDLISEASLSAYLHYFNTADIFFLRFSNCDVIFPFHYFT